MIDYESRRAQTKTVQGPSHVFEGHSARIYSMALCTLPNGNRIAASASHDRTVRIWCLTHNRELRKIEYSDFVWRVFLVTTPLNAVRVVAYVSARDEIHVSDIETGEELFVINGRLVFAGPLCLYRCPVIVALIDDVDIAIVDADTGLIRRRIVSGFAKAFRAVVSTDVAPSLIFNTWNAQNRRSSIQVYDLSVEGTTAADIVFPKNTYGYVKFSGPTTLEPFVPDRMKVMFEGDSKDGITSIAISQSQRQYICSGHYDNVIRVWDLNDRQLLLVLEGHEEWVVSVTIWKGIEPIVVSGSSDGTIKVWDLQNGDLITTCEGHQRDVWAVTCTTGPNPILVSASSDRTVRTWDINRRVMDLKWKRRKAYCIFLWRSNMLGNQHSARKPSSCDDIGGASGGISSPSAVVVSLADASELGLLPADPSSAADHGGGTGGGAGVADREAFEVGIFDEVLSRSSSESRASSPFRSWDKILSIPPVDQSCDELELQVSTVEPRPEPRSAPIAIPPPRSAPLLLEDAYSGEGCGGGRAADGGRSSSSSSPQSPFCSSAWSHLSSMAAYVADGLGFWAPVNRRGNVGEGNSAVCREDTLESCLDRASALDCEELTPELLFRGADGGVGVGMGVLSEEAMAAALASIEGQEAEELQRVIACRGAALLTKKALAQIAPCVSLFQVFQNQHLCKEIASFL